MRKNNQKTRKESQGEQPRNFYRSLCGKNDKVIKMKNLENVSKLFQDPESVKVVSTISKEGELHSIVAGSVMVVDEDTMAVAEVFMNTSSANLNDNNKVALLAVKGMESYLINGTVLARNTSGALYDAVAANFAKMNMQIKAVWTFTVDKIFDESAGPNGGKQIF